MADAAQQTGLPVTYTYGAVGRSGWGIRPGDRVSRFTWDKTGPEPLRVPHGTPGVALSCFKQSICGTFLCTVIWDGDQYAAPGHTMAGDLVTIQPSDECL